MKLTVTQILICALSSTYWLSSCGNVLPFLKNDLVCVGGIIAVPMASLLGVVLVGLCAQKHQYHIYLGLFIWLLSALFVYSFTLN